MPNEKGNNSRFKGAGAEYLAMGALLITGKNIYSYTLNNGDVDFIIEERGTFIKAQVKSFYKENKRGKRRKLVADISKGTEFYTSEDIDVLLLVDTETAEIFWMDMPINNKKYISKTTAIKQGTKIYPLTTESKDTVINKNYKINTITHTLPPATHSSKYKGVSWDKKENKWRSRITYKGVFKHIGYYENEEEAARAYDQAALKFFGEDTFLNFKS